MTDLTDQALQREAEGIKKAEDGRNETISELMLIRFKYIQPHLNTFRMDFDKTEICVDRKESAYFYTPGYLEIEGVTLSYILKMTAQEITFAFDIWLEGTLTKYRFSETSNLAEYTTFLSNMLLSITRCVNKLKKEQLEKIEKLATDSRCDYHYFLNDLQKNVWIDKVTKATFYKKYSWLAQVQQLKKTLAIAQREYSQIHIKQFNEEYEKLFAQWKKDFDIWVYAFEQQNYTPVDLYRLTYFPKDVTLSTIHIEDDELAFDYSELYLHCDVTSDEPDEVGYYTRFKDGIKIKILGQLVSVTKQTLTKPTSAHCHSLRLPGDLPGYGYKTYIYVNPKDREKIEEKLNNTERPSILTREEFMISKGCVKNGNDWVFNS